VHTELYVYVANICAKLVRTRKL